MNFSTDWGSWWGLRGECAGWHSVLCVPVNIKRFVGFFSSTHIQGYQNVVTSLFYPPPYKLKKGWYYSAQFYSLRTTFLLKQPDISTEHVLWRTQTKDSHVVIINLCIDYIQCPNVQVHHSKADVYLHHKECSRMPLRKIFHMTQQFFVSLVLLDPSEVHKQ